MTNLCILLAQTAKIQFNDLFYDQGSRFSKHHPIYLLLYASLTEGGGSLDSTKQSVYQAGS